MKKNEISVEPVDAYDFFRMLRKTEDNLIELKLADPKSEGLKKDIKELKKIIKGLLKLMHKIDQRFEDDQENQEIKEGAGALYNLAQISDTKTAELLERLKFEEQLD